MVMHAFECVSFLVCLCYISENLNKNKINSKSNQLSHISVCCWVHELLCCDGGEWISAVHSHWSEEQLGGSKCHRYRQLWSGLGKDISVLLSSFIDLF